MERAERLQPLRPLLFPVVLLEDDRAGERLNRGSHQSRAPRLRREARPASPGRCRMPALHRSPRHPAAGPGSSSRSPAALHQARDLASRAGNTAVQRQRMSRHPGCRTPGTPAPPPVHHRATRLLHDPETRRRGRAVVETPGDGAHRVEPAVRSRIQPAGNVPGRRLPGCHSCRAGQEQTLPRAIFIDGNRPRPTAKNRQTGHHAGRGLTIKIPLRRSAARVEESSMS